MISAASLFPPRFAQRPLLCAAALAVTFGGPVALEAQRPTALVSAATRSASFHGIAAHSAPESPAADPQSPPSPPPAPDPSSLKDDLFAGTTKFAKNASEATEVNMDPDSLRMVGGADARRAHRTLLSVVRHYEYDKPGMYSMADVDEFRHKLETGDWHCSVHTRDLKSGESTDICNRHRSDGLIENAIITVEPKELTFIHNIQRPNGEGGHVLDLNEAPGMSMLPDFMPDGSVAAIAPQVQAEVAASMAGMAAEQATMRAELLASSARLQAEMRHFKAPEVHIDAEQLRKEMEGVQKSLKDLPSLDEEKLREQLQQENLPNQAK